MFLEQGEIILVLQILKLLILGNLFWINSHKAKLNANNDDDDSIFYICNNFVLNQKKKQNKNAEKIFFLIPEKEFIE